jgi:hypothetical protein
MNYDATVLMGLAGMAVVALRVGWQIMSGVKSDIEAGLVHGLEQGEALKARLFPTCEWCRTDLVVDSKGVCAGCGARP